MSPSNSEFQQHGYLQLPRAGLGLDLDAMEREYTRLETRALACLGQRAGAVDAEGEHGLIAVAEAAQPGQLCRFEYLAGASAWMRLILAPRLGALVSAVLAQPVRLFKDKCNLKQPGGGGFPPHQDITAYACFPTRYQVTAALMLDAADAGNGALEVAHDWRAAARGAPCYPTPRGPQARLPSEQGGARHGDILAACAAQIDWLLLPAAAGDVILFDCYLPHRSAANASGRARRALFFTFNLASEGDLYALYYRAKRQHPHDPRFHVSTPTARADQP